MTTRRLGNRKTFCHYQPEWKWLWKIIVVVKWVLMSKLPVLFYQCWYPILIEERNSREMMQTFQALRYKGLIYCSRCFPESVSMILILVIVYKTETSTAFIHYLCCQMKARKMNCSSDNLWKIEPQRFVFNIWL